MKDDDSIFGAAPDGLDRLVFEAWQNPEADREVQPTITAQVFLEQPGEHIGRYKLLTILGEGGMGIVYLAEQERPVKRQVALKVIKPGMDSKRVLARFEAEQQALALMEHPHVARVHDAGLTPSGRPYFVMEHVKGVPITNYCDKHRLTIEERLRLFLHVCEAVQHAHQKGIIHRDLKPSNILVATEDEQASPKVIDFGVARAVSQPLTERTLYTEQGQLVGTPEYMSPEQADPGSRDLDTRTDVYSLGVVLYELIAGVLPFDPHALREHGIEGARKVICDQDPQTPSTRLSRTSAEESTRSALQRRTNTRQLQRRLRGDLDWITLKAMAKDRTRRYPSAGDLAADVVRHLNDEPVTAGRPSPIYKAGKFVRRHRALVTGSAAVLIVLVAGIVASLTFAVRAERARDEAGVTARFLEDVLASIDGWERGGRQTAIKDILNAASRKVSDEFGNAPLTEAAIRQRLGGLYLRVEAPQEAEGLLRRSLEIFTRELGPQAPQTLEALNLLGRAHWYRWRYSEAEEYFSRVLDARRRVLGPEAPDTLNAMAWLGWSHFGNGRADKAESLLSETYETARRTLGERHELTMQSMFFYGAALLFRGRNAEGERILAEALEHSRKTLPPAHPFAIFVTAMLGRQYSCDGRYAETQEILGEALDMSRKAWGERNCATGRNVAALAENCARQGRIAEAETLLLDAIERGRQTEELDPQIVIRDSYALGFFYTWQRRLDEAEQVIHSALQASIDAHGENHPITFLGRIALAMTYREQGRYVEADKQLGMPVGVPDLGDTSVHVVNTMHQLAIVRQQQGRYAEAEALHLRILNARRTLLVENHPHTLGTIRGLIALYTAWAKHQEARKWFDVLMAAYADRSAASQARPATAGSVLYDAAMDTYTLAGPPSPPWTVERELDFSLHEPSSEMWHVCDDLHFVCKALHGDGSITAKIEGISPAHYGTQVGLMIRSTLAPTSPHASVIVTPLGDVACQHRSVEFGATRSEYAAANARFPRWLKLTRRGNLFTAQHSGDGANWEPVQSNGLNQSASVEIPSGETAYIGFTLTSHDLSRNTEARVSHVTVIGNASPPGPFIECRDISLQLPPSPDGGSNR